VGEKTCAQQASSVTVNTKSLIAANLDYAKQLEKIV